MSIHVVVMGVAGCGKSTVAEAIHERLGYYAILLSCVMYAVYNMTRKKR